MKRTKQFMMFGIVGLLAVFTILSAGMIQTDVSSGDSISSDSINYHSSVCKYVTRSDGTVDDIGCSHNLLTNAGKEAIQASLSGEPGPIFNYIALCDASTGCGAPAAGDTTLENEIAGSGLQRAKGSVGDLGVGNWSVAKTFTAATNNMLTNKTGLFNDPSAGTLLAENTFTLVTLQTGDQLTINWTISVS